MGYNLSIGSAEVMLDLDHKYVTIDCNPCESNDAPDYGDINTTKGIRWPSYTQWSKFAKHVDLEDFFFGEQGVMREHPGNYPLDEKDYQIITKAKDNYFIKNMGVLVGVDKWKVPEDDTDFSTEDLIRYNYTRLHWLHYWVRFALDNCEYPIFSNS